MTKRQKLKLIYQLRVQQLNTARDRLHEIRKTKFVWTTYEYSRALYRYERARRNWRAIRGWS